MSPTFTKKFKKPAWLFFIYNFSHAFLITIFAEFLANDKPLLVRFNNKFYFPVIQNIPEKNFGGEFETQADFRDLAVQELINKNEG
jgi:microcin C transport system permease protein